MTDTKEPVIRLEHWQAREANCDRMQELAEQFFDPDTESAAWLTTGWGRSIVRDAEVTTCREYMVCTADPNRLSRFADLLRDERLISSSSGNDRFWPAEATRGRF